MLIALTTSCATPPPAPVQTIEPPAASDSAFVLSRNPSGAKPAVELAPVHINEQWFGFRGEFLKQTEAQVRDRDAAISDKQAPADFWDQQTAVETISIWTMFCNECHGGRRKLEDAVKMTVPAPGWGKGEGLFFGSRRPYAEIFKTISNGKIEKEGNRWKMPAWKGKLSKEQIWSLIYFVEYQSGGIEGRFPPSLYPRSESADR
jgi:mono/diheme cytochrome c family protein